MSTTDPRQPERLSTGPTRLLHALSSRIGEATTTTVKHGVLAAELGVCRRTIIRWEQTLIAEGLIQVEHQSIGGNQVANLYRIADPQKCHTISSTASVKDRERSSTPFPEQQQPHPQLRREQGGIGKTRNQSPPTKWGGGIWELADRYQDAQWLVDHFAVALAKRDGQLKRESYRRGGWKKTAVQLIVNQRRPLAQVMEVVDFAFSHTLTLADEIHTVVSLDDSMPHWMSWGDGYRRPVRLTRLVQIAQHYDLIRDHYQGLLDVMGPRKRGPDVSPMEGE